MKIEVIKIESIDIKIEKSQTGTETESHTQMDIKQGSAPETDLQAESQEEIEPHKTEDRPEIEKYEIETQIQSADVSESQTEIKSNTEIQQAAAGDSVSASDYMVSIRGIAVALQGDMRNLVSALGDPDGYSAAKCCVETGEDKKYIWRHHNLHVCYKRGRPHTLIEVTGSEPLPSGICIRSTKVDVIVVYESGYMEEGTELLYESSAQICGIDHPNDKGGCLKGSPSILKLRFQLVPTDSRFLPLSGG